MESLATIAEVFRNASVPQQPQLAQFGLCYVAFVGEHERRYRGERLLQIAAQQASAAAMAHDISLRQCLITDQPERRRPYIQDIIPLLSSADAAPFLSRCDEYTRRFSRPCKLYFGYMAKAIAVARAPYELTLFADTDTFICTAKPFPAIQRLMKEYDVLTLFPRTTQGWVNSGLMAVRRSATADWAARWLDEFKSLDDFGDQLHLLKVLPYASRGAIPAQPLRVGELAAELHLRHGSVADVQGQVWLAPLRGEAMMLHSKGLASVTGIVPRVLSLFRARGDSLSSSQQQLLTRLSTPETALAQRAHGADAPGTRASIHRRGRQLAQVAKEGGRGAAHPPPPYSPRALAAVCLLLNDGVPWSGTRQVVLNSNASCVGCSDLTHSPGGAGVISDPSASAGAVRISLGCLTGTVPSCCAVAAYRLAELNVVRCCVTSLSLDACLSARTKLGSMELHPTEKIL